MFRQLDKLSPARNSNSSEKAHCSNSKRSPHASRYCQSRQSEQSSPSTRTLKPLRFISFYNLFGGILPRSPCAATLLKVARKSSPARNPNTSEKAHRTNSKRSPQASRNRQSRHSEQGFVVTYSTSSRLVYMYCRCQIL